MKYTENESNYFFTTAIIRLKDEFDLKSAIKALKELEIESRKEEGNIVYEVQQIVDEKNHFIVWECYETKEAFNSHLKSSHFYEFENTKMFEFIKGYLGRKI